MKSENSLARARLCLHGLTRGMLLAGAAMMPLSAPRAQSMDYGSLEQVFGEPVTTAATGTPQRASLAPADMVIITQDDIRRSGADNLPDILAMVPGVDVRRPTMGNADVAIHGYNQQSNPRTLVLLNGRPVYDDFYGFVAWSQIPVQLDEIRQIEVVKGPASALFGFNAASGVINIVTFDPLYDSVNSVTARAGTQSATELAGVTTVNQPGVYGLRLSAGGIRSDEFDRTPAEARPAVHPVSGSVNALGTYKLPSGLQMTLEAGLSKDDFNVYDVAPYGFDIRGDDLRAVLSDTTLIGQTSAQFYRNESRQDIGPGSDATDDVYDVQLTDLLKLGVSHVLRFGLEWKDNSATSDSFLHGTAGYTDFAASGMWNWQMTDAVAMTNAARVDELSLRYTGPGLPAFDVTQQAIDARKLTGLSFNSGLVWQVTAKDTVRLTGGRGLQLPSLFGFSASLALAPGFYDVGTPTLLPSAVTSVELGYDRQLTELLSVAHASVFAERNDDLITGGIAGVPVVTPAGVGLSAKNVGHSDAAGFEIGIKGEAPCGISWNGYWAVESITDHIQAGLPHNEQTDFESSTPRNVVFLGLGYHSGKLEADVSSRWQSQYHDFGGASLLSPSEIVVGDFVTVNARLGYQIYPHTTLAVSGNQFLYNRLAETIGPATERRVLVSLSYKL